MSHETEHEVEIAKINRRRVIESKKKQEPVHSTKFPVHKTNKKHAERRAHINERKVLKK